MTLSTRIAVAAATAAVALGGTVPAVASSKKHWSKSQCTSYAKKYEKAKGKIEKDANNYLKEHGCKQRVK